ncbi:MAG: phosphoribosyltransferase [Bacteroidia bacterium]|jgi:pyrimidine operon attenuation protein/uracil phosphoribosyltransferase|nr:phosphoribosyltransferase [Bacteroidia bacterium]
MSESVVQILNDAQVKQIIKRIAYQIYENHFNNKELIIGGIAGRGATVAQLIYDELVSISKLNIQLVTVSLDKDNPTGGSVTLSSENTKIEGKSVIVIDDVLNTGRTLVYALTPFIRAKAKRIQVGVLVDRNHKNFPVAADYIGMQLSTTLQEHVDVRIEKKKVNVYLR